MPGWVLDGAYLDFDFLSNLYYLQGFGETGTITNVVTTTRASVGYGQQLDGIWVPFGVNEPRLTDKGLLIEQARTNSLLWCRDMTNAAWVKTDVTATLDQTGITGEANAATRLTATAANATVLQTLAHASASRIFSVWAKRITGAGVIEATIDNGSTWVAISVGPDWAQLPIPAQTLANSVSGLRIVTSGDEIAVDFAQNENVVGPAVASSPILTTTVAVTRATDVIDVINPPTLGSAASLYASAIRDLTPAIGGAFLLVPNDGTANNTLRIQLSPASGSPPEAGQLVLVVAGVNQDIPAATGWTPGTPHSAAAAWRSGSQVIALDGVAATPTTDIDTIPAGLTELRLGLNRAATNNGLMGYLRRVAVWPTVALPTSFLEVMTA